MVEHPDYTLVETDQRSIVRLRVLPCDAESIAAAMQLPQQPLQSIEGAPSIHWLGPDQWLLTSKDMPVADILAHIDHTLSGQLFAATDMSSGLVCLSLCGQSSRIVLAMGCGIDMRRDSFITGHCVRTRFAQVPVLMVAAGEFEFDLYVDRSYAHYLQEWLSHAGQDPITQSHQLASP